jgi:hypothetical protein
VRHENRELLKMAGDVSGGGSLMDPFGSAPAAQAKPPKTALWHNVRAYCVNVQIKDTVKSGIFYRACPHEVDDGRGGRRMCMKKVIMRLMHVFLSCQVEEDMSAGGYRCDNGHVSPRPALRYTASILIADETGQMFVRAFHDQIRQLLEIDAEEFERIENAKDMTFDDTMFQTVLKRATFRQFIFKLKSTKDMFADEERTNTTVVDMFPVDISHECSLMLPETAASGFGTSPSGQQRSSISSSGYFPPLGY